MYYIRLHICSGKILHQDTFGRYYFHMNPFQLIYTFQMVIILLMVAGKYLPFFHRRMCSKNSLLLRVQGKSIVFLIKRKRKYSYKVRKSSRIIYSSMMMILIFNLPFELHASDENCSPTIDLLDIRSLQFDGWWT